MLIYDVLHKEKVYRSVINDLRGLGVKHRLKKSGISNKNDKNDSRNLRKVFKVSLSYQPLDVVNLPSGGIVHVPVFLCQATSYLEKCINQEGLFRKAGSHIRQKELVARLDNGGILGEKNHAIDVANCLKTFFRDLPEPLIPFAYHDLFVRCLVLRDHRVRALLLACILLPPHHLNTLAFFMGFLKRVSLYESQNKMSVDNLAKVIGPNVMPLQETTMSAVQSRLEAHLLIVKILIENAEKIGVLPDHISESISAETTGSIETELDRSDSSSRARGKKKKHRSGSLTRMLNGLKKMVGKSGSPGEANQANNQLVPVETDPLHTPSIKTGKKRKVGESGAPISVKKKRDVLDSMPERTSHHHTRTLLASPVSSNPNPIRERSPVHKSKVRKYLTHKVHSEIRVFDKVDKSKKLRMSLDRLVSRSKQKVADVEMGGVGVGGGESCKESYSPCIERRWSSASSSSARKKKRDIEEENSGCQGSPLIRKATTLVNVRDEFDHIFMEADVNLSDDCTDSTSKVNISENYNNGMKKGNRVSCCRRSLEASLIPKSTTNNYYETRKEEINREVDSSLRGNNDRSEEYVTIPKSVYEDIKSRVSAIETRISQEFGSIASENDENSLINSASNVQTEYEKTLGEASIESTITADNLAKRLSKELKIRRSAEHKIIRSPSARKIGILRRRSQEKAPSRRVSRSASWNASNFAPKTDNRSTLINYYPDVGLAPDSICSDETNERLDYLHKQLHTLITHTAEHTRGSFSDEDNCLPEDDDDRVFEPVTNKLAPNVRRASSFHGNEFIDNSHYFNNRVKQLKKTNSQQNVTRGNFQRSDVPTTFANDGPRQKTISWKDAAGYFKLENRSNVNTPVPSTGRASIAKLRTQNAGMVLAKAKLFDEAKNSGETTIDAKHHYHDNNNHQTGRVTRVRQVKNLDVEANSPRKNSTSNRRKHCRSPKNNNARLRLASSSPNYSPLIKMEVTIVPPHNTQRQATEKRANRRATSHKFEQENREITRNNINQTRNNKDETFGERSNSVGHNSANNILQEANINIYDPDVNSTCKTPHIKRPLAVKTPKSARSLARRAVVDTRRTPLKAVPSLGTPKRQSPRIVAKSRQLSKPLN